MNDHPIKATILGCGSSLGVPAAGNFWGECNPDNPKNRRTRSSLLVQSEHTNMLVDTTVDVRYHLNKYNINRLDGVFLTHSHSDHVNGVDDLRVISYAMGHPLKTFANDETADDMQRRFGYVFQGGQDVYRPFMQMQTIEYGPHRVGDMRMDLFRQEHGTCETVGIRINDFAWSVDMVDLDEDALKTLKGVKTWVVDGGGYKREEQNLYTHANIDRVKRWSEQLEIPQVYLIVLTGMMDYDVLCNELPSHIRPAYDGLVLNI